MRERKGFQFIILNNGKIFNKWNIIIIKFYELRLYKSFNYGIVKKIINILQFVIFYVININKINNCPKKKIVNEINELFKFLNFWVIWRYFYSFFFLL